MYQRAREQLVEELGIGPSPELQELHRRILNQDKTLIRVPERVEAPTVKASGPARHAPSGGGRELAELSAAGDLRLVKYSRPRWRRQDTAGTRNRTV